MKFRFATIVFVLLTLSACKKYPDGPGISLASKKSRVEGTCRIHQVLKGNTDVTADVNQIYRNYSINLTKNGSYSLSYYDNYSNPYSESGSWRFSDTKRQIILEPDDPNAQYYTLWHILRLTKDEFWFKQADGSNLPYEFHLAQ